MTLAATILVPTTGDRGPLLPHSVGSALRQSVDDIEILVIGDGVDPSTRAVAESLCEQDERVRFFDFPKHQRRGEPNRHQVLTTEARGEIVCYLTDRDLYFPDHVEEMRRLLSDADFAHTLRAGIGDGGVRFMRQTCDLRDPEIRARFADPRTSIPLSMTGHTMAAYRRLPEGWRTTPPGIWTDHYMWQQFLAEPWVHVAASTLLTVLYFHRAPLPAWSTESRLELLESWAPRLRSAEQVATLRREMSDHIWHEWAHLREQADRRVSNRLVQGLAYRSRVIRRRLRSIRRA